MDSRGLNEEQEYLAAVQQDGNALKDVPEEKKTEAICLAAVSKHGGALRYVTADKQTEAVCLAAVQQDGLALFNIPEDKQTEAVRLAAIQQNRQAFQYIPEDKRAELLSLVKDQDKLFTLPGFPEGLPRMVLHPASRDLFERGKEGQGYVWIAWKDSDDKEENLTIALIPAYNKGGNDIGLDKMGKPFEYYVNSPQVRGGNTGVVHSKGIDELEFNKVKPKGIRDEHMFGGGLFKDKRTGSEPFYLLLEFMNKSGNLNMPSVCYCRELVLALYYGYFEDRSDPVVSDEVTDYYQFYIQRELPRDLTHAICDFLVANLPCPPDAKREAAVISQQHLAATWWDKNRDNFPLINAKLMQSFFIAIKKGHNSLMEEILVYIKKNLIKMYPEDSEKRKRELCLLLNTQFGEKQNTALLTAVAMRHYYLATLLLKEGASLSVRNAENHSVLNTVFKDKTPTTAEEIDLLKALWTAVGEELKTLMRLPTDKTERAAALHKISIIIEDIRHLQRYVYGSARKLIKELLSDALKDECWDVVSILSAHRQVSEEARLSSEQVQIMRDNAMDLAKAFIRYGEGISSLEERRELVTKVLNQQNELGVLLDNPPGPVFFGPHTTSTAISPALQCIADAFKDLNIERRLPAKSESLKEKNANRLEQEMFRQDANSGKAKRFKFH